MLNNLIDLHVGPKTYDYMKAFLTDRTVKLVVGGMESATISLGNHVTPQGTVLPPFLFSVAMIKLPYLLSAIPHVHHSLYADDTTIWTAGGSDAYIEDRLQQAVDIVEAYAGERGLMCFPQKSELLLFSPPDKRHHQGTPDIQLTIEDRVIPIVPCIRVLRKKP